MYNSNFRRRENRDFLKPGELRTNFQIRVPQVRLIHNEEQLGVVPTDDARRMAEDAGLDLVEMVPNASPPICKIMDYGKYKYEKKIKDKESARKQREAAVQYKEIRLRPSIASGDVETKTSQAKRFLSEGYKVQLVVQFKGREMAHRENGMLLVNKIIQEMSVVASVESQPKFEGNKITCCLVSK